MFNFLSPLSIIGDRNKNKTLIDVKKLDDFEKKNDESPITAADLCSHEIISDSLSKLTPKIPILSEES